MHPKMKKRYAIMKTFSNDTAYQSVLQNTYKQARKNYIINIALSSSTIISLLCIVASCTLGFFMFCSKSTISNTVFSIIFAIGLFSFITFVVMISVDLEKPINVTAVNYLNDIAKQNCKVIKDNDNVHLIINNSMLYIVVDGKILNKSFEIQDKDINKYKVKIQEYFIIEKNGYVNLCNDYVVLYDGQLISINTKP